MLRIFRNNKKNYQYKTQLDLKNELSHIIVWVIMIICTHIYLMIVIENFSLEDAIWLTLTTITTVGYGDLEATTTAGRIATILLLYVGGIYAVAQAVGVYLDYQAQRSTSIRLGDWEWEMRDHIIIFNKPEDNSIWYLSKLAQQLRSRSSTLADKQFLIVSDGYSRGLPKELADLGYFYQNSIPNNLKALVSANTSTASHIVIFAPHNKNLLADAETFDLVHRIRDLNKDAMLVAEVYDDHNRIRVQEAGANIAMRPMHGYPEMLARAIIAPGAETIIEQVFTSGGDECVRFDLEIEDVTWSQLVNIMLEQNCGMPLAYRDKNNDIQINPKANSIVHAIAIFVLVKEDNISNMDNVIDSFFDNVKKLG